ncbi:glycerol uptake facilitator protein [Catalinimonas alkaloidigena]|uniref:Glycerol uptake facilitator protein n=1 Tax=Catalinimonas alkaloidigena TaxID=1075417 RepID=A0A1G9PJU1_9BACT|nr:MIP/aquaporin family protein [Catalinimonas alkaloidigena]SDL99078.1 glycerol uptake facilitator protein [Catalinimonas alkaloidigena]
MTPFLAEFIGTALLLLLGNGVVANVVLNQTKGHNSGWIVITVGWAMAVFVGVFVTSDFSGAHLNPAVTIGLATAGVFPWADVPAYLLAQFLGGALGATLVWVMHRPHYEVTENPNAKMATFCTDPAIRNLSSNLFSEILGTFVLVFAVLFLAAPTFSVTSLPDAEFGLGALGAVPVAFLVLAIGLSLGGTTGYAINPARDLSPRLMHALLPIEGKRDSNWSYAWVPVVGPVVGSVLAGLLYLLLSPTP